MRSVFDVSADLMKIADLNALPTVKLQKLVYYAFGWYGRLTGEALFDQQFYAMQHGPVVGALLSLHAGQTEIPRDDIEEARSAFEDSYVEPEPFYEAVLHAVMDYYGQMGTWDLRDLTHEDAVWKDAWEARSVGSRRATLEQSAIIDFFMSRDIPPALARALPEPSVSRVSPEEWAQIEGMSTEPTEAEIAFLRMAFQ